MITYEQAIELLTTLRSLKPAPGSKLEYARAKTLRAMKNLIDEYNQKVEDIDDEEALVTEDEKKNQIISRRTTIDPVSHQEIQIPLFSKEGEEKRKRRRRELLKQVAPEFAIHSTADGASLNTYEKLVLAEFGFFTGPVEPAPEESENTAKFEEPPAK